MYAGDPNTNTVEGYFSILKRGIYAVYHHVSQAHLKRYLCEFDFRYNYRVALGFTDKQRTDACVASQASACLIGGLVAKPKQPEPPKPIWPDGSPYVEPVQLKLAL
jgi:hypothetical protein